MRPLVGFRPPLLIEAELELLDPAPYPRQVGIGWSREGLETYKDRGNDLPLMAVTADKSVDWQTKELRRQDTARISFTDGGQTYNMRLPPGQPHRLQVRLWEQACEYRVDDRWLAAPLPAKLNAEGWLCLGDCYPEPRGSDMGAFRLRSVRLRRIETAAPPQETAPSEERARYWEDRLALDSDDLVSAIHLLPIRYEQGRDDEVLALADRAEGLGPGVNGVRKWRGAALARRGDYAGAVAIWKVAREEESGQDFELFWRTSEVLAAAPDDAVRDGKRALGLAEVATGSSAPRDPRAIAAKGAAYAELGNFAEAIKAQEQVLKDPGAAEHGGEARLALYREGKPYRLPASGTSGVRSDASSSPAGRNDSR